ncbi:MAG: hypothetical protein GHCLOJNM_03568 [bacterium]|nr:hypothetical protein [bacterium]
MPTINGIAHSPGYGSWALIGKLFLLLPGLPPAQAMNLMTACFGAAAVFVAAYLASVWSGSLAAGVCAGLALGTTRIAWENSVVAEVYAPQTFYVLGAFALFVLPRLEGQANPWPWWRAGALLAGWAIGYRPDSALVFIPCFAFVVIETWREHRLAKLVGLPLLALVGALPSLLYLVLADVRWNHPASLYNLLRPYYELAYDRLPERNSFYARHNADSLLHGNWFERFRWLYGCESVRWFYGATGWADSWGELRKFVGVTFKQLGPVVLLLALYSLRGGRDQKRLPEVLAWVIFGAYLYSYVDLAITGQEYYYPPLWGLLCCLAVVGWTRLPRVPLPHRLNLFGDPPFGRTSLGIEAIQWLRTDFVRALCMALLFLFPFTESARQWGSLREFSSGEAVRYHNKVVRALAKNLPVDSVVVSAWGPGNALLYALHVEERRGDVTVVCAPAEEKLEICSPVAAKYAGRPVFLYHWGATLHYFVPAGNGKPERLVEGEVWYVNCPVCPEDARFH